MLMSSRRRAGGASRTPVLRERFLIPLSLGTIISRVLEVDILWPRWVARIGVTRATEACFLTADRQCTAISNTLRLIFVEREIFEDQQEITTPSDLGSAAC